MNEFVPQWNIIGHGKSYFWFLADETEEAISAALTVAESLKTTCTFDGKLIADFTNG